MNSTLKTILKIVAVVMSIAAVVAAVFGVVTYLKKKKAQREENVTVFPEEYADFADVDVV